MGRSVTAIPFAAATSEAVCSLQRSLLLIKHLSHVMFIGNEMIAESYSDCWRMTGVFEQECDGGLDSFRGQVIQRPDNLRFNRQPGSFGKFECIAGGLGVFGGSLSRLCRLIPLKFGVVGIQANDADGENAVGSGNSEPFFPDILNRSVA